MVHCCQRTPNATKKGKYTKDGTEVLVNEDVAACCAGTDTRPLTQDKGKGKMAAYGLAQNGAWVRLRERERGAQRIPDSHPGLRFIRQYIF